MIEIQPKNQPKKKIQKISSSNLIKPNEEVEFLSENQLPIGNSPKAQENIDINEMKKKKKTF